MFVAFAAITLTATPVLAEWVDWIADATVAWEFNNNLPASTFEEDEKEDSRWHPTARLGRVLQIADRSRLSLSAAIDGLIYLKWDGLNATIPSGSIALFHKFGFGSAPWVRWHFLASYLSVDDSQRTGAAFETGVQGGKRFSPRASASWGYLYVDRDGDTDVFRQERHSVFVAGDLLLTRQLMLSGGYAYWNGDFHSACNPTNVAEVRAVEGANVRALQLDNVFGGCVYRLSGDAHETMVNLNYGFGNRYSIDAGYRFRRGKGRELTYTSHIATTTVLFSY